MIYSARQAPTTGGILLGYRQQPKAPTGFAVRESSNCTSGEPIFYDGDGHLLTIAPTGAGKGVSVAVPALLEYPGPIVAMDLKPELAAITARRRRAMGHRVVCIAPFVPGSDGLNPFDLWKLPGAQIDVDSEVLAAALSVGRRFGTDPYWSDSANGLIAGLIAHVATSAPMEKRNLNEVRRWLFADDLDYDLAVSLDNKTVVNNMAREKFVAYLTAPSDRTRPCIRSTAMSHLDTLGSKSIQSTLERSTFDLQDIVAGADIDVFFMLPADRLESHAAVMRLYLSTILTAIIRRPSIPRQRTLLLVDEAGQLGGLDALRQAITLFRGAGLTAWLFFQDVSQIRRNFERDWETIVNNCGVIQAFGIHSHLMALMISQLIGLPPRELMNMAPNQQALSIHRQGAFVCHKLNYRRDPRFAGLFDDNPRYAQVDETGIR